MQAEYDAAVQENRNKHEKMQADIKAQEDKQKAEKAAAEAAKKKLPPSTTGEDWAVHMPEHHFNSHAQQRARSYEDSESDSDSDSDSDDE